MEYCFVLPQNDYLLSSGGYCLVDTDRLLRITAFLFTSYELIWKPLLKLKLRFIAGSLLIVAAKVLNCCILEISNFTQLWQKYIAMGDVIIIIIIIIIGFLV